MSKLKTRVDELEGAIKRVREAHHKLYERVGKLEKQINTPVPTPKVKPKTKPKTQKPKLAKQPARKVH